MEELSTKQILLKIDNHIFEYKQCRKSNEIIENHIPLILPSQITS